MTGSRPGRHAGASPADTATVPTPDAARSGASSGRDLGYGTSRMAIRGPSRHTETSHALEGASRPVAGCAGGCRGSRIACRIELGGGSNRSAQRRRREWVEELSVLPMVSADDRLAREEADLVARIAAGDIGDPVAELYRRYSGRLYRYGVQGLGNAGLAEEMVQECFVRLWRTADRFDADRGTVAAYLFVIARSIAADLRKRPSSRPLMAVEDASLPPEPDRVDRVLQSVMVREALDSLSAAHMQVLRLAYGEGLTQSQIAARLGLPLGTVKTRMFHGLRALRAALIERGFDDGA